MHVTTTCPTDFILNVSGCRWRCIQPFTGKGSVQHCMTEFPVIFRSFRPAGSIPPRETWVHSQKFLEKRGFYEVRRSWEAHLDVSKLDFSPFWEHLERVRKTGITITTLAEEKTGSRDWFSKIYELLL